MGGAFCTSCGSGLAEGASFCDSCGASVEVDDLTEDDAASALTEDEGEAPSARSPEDRRRRLRRLGTAMVVIGILAIGLSGGYLLGKAMTPTQAAPTDRADLSDMEVSVEDLEEGELPAGIAGEVLEVTMPDLVGLSQEHALDALVDAGIDPAVVATEERPFVGETGVVVAQDPIRQTGDPSEVTLFVSTEAQTPDVIDDSEEDAIAALEQLGSEVEVQYVYVAGVEAGSVVAIDPEAGEPASEQVALSVSTDPAEVFLTQVDIVDGSPCSAGAYRIDGTEYPDSLQCSVSSRDSSAEYLLDRSVERFRATIGVDDEAADDVPIRMRVVGDGDQLAEETISYGTSADIDVDVQGVLRLAIIVETVDPDDGSTALVLGEAKFVGSPDAVTGLIRSS